MKRLLTIMLIAIMALSVPFNQATAQEEKETLVQIDTNMGKIKVKLYNDTPQHRDNFIKNVKENLYNGLLFHRVISQFMIQGGDINSKDAPADKHLGDGDPDYKIPAEIVYPTHYHKAGALCAARTSDEVNPQKESSASQFYIVTGKFYTSMELDKMEKNEGKKFTEAQRQSYMLEGGRPDLDNKYTVFGEVVKGMNVVLKIQQVQTNEEDRPLKNVVIKSMKIVEK